MRKFLGPAIAVLLAVGIGVGLNQLLGLPLVAAIPMVLFALVINGFVATVEDDLPGGFNNPDGSSTPGYVTKLRGVTVGVVGVALLLVVLIFAVARWPT